MTTETVSEPVAIVNPLIVAPKTQTGAAQLWQPWTLIVPALLVLPLLCLAVSWQISPTTDDILLNKRHHRVEAQPTLPPQTPSQLNIFVPGDDEALHRRSFNSSLNIYYTEIDKEQRLEGITALKMLFAAAPKYFPPGTEVEELSLEQTESGSNIAHVSLNATFWNSDYWLMDSRPQLTIQAIAHTLAGVYAASPADFRVLLLRDDQNPGHLGQDDIADPIALDDGVLGAPSATATPAPPAVTWPAPAKPSATVAAP